VLVLVDVESLARTLHVYDRDPADAPRLLEAVASADQASRAARVAYGTASRNARLQRALADAGYHTIDVPGHREQLRLRLALDALDAARGAEAPETLVVVADDLELGDLFRRLRAAGSAVVVVGRRHPALLEATDRVVDARELEALVPRAAAPRAEEPIASRQVERYRGAGVVEEAYDDDTAELDDDADDLAADDDEEGDEDEYEEELADQDEDDDLDDDDIVEADDDAGEYDDELAGTDDIGGEDAEPGGYGTTRDASAFELAFDEEEAGDELPFDAIDDDDAGATIGAAPADEASEEPRPGQRRRRRSRGGRRRRRGGAAGAPAVAGADTAAGELPAVGERPAAGELLAAGERPVGVPRGFADSAVARRRPRSEPGDSFGLLREALDRVLEGPPRLVWGSLVLEAMQELEPTFGGGDAEFGSFEGLLEEAQRRGVLKLERSPDTDSYLVTAVAID
jgi:hypothetical protein